MHKRLYDFLEINNVIDPLEFGFQKKHSAAHVRTSLTEKVKLLMMEIMVAVFLLI